MRSKKAKVELTQKEKIKAKIDEVIETIINKDPKDITYNEYRILDSKLISIKYEEEQEAKSKEMSELWAKAMSNSICGGSCCTPCLPDPVKED